MSQLEIENHSKDQYLRQNFSGQIVPPYFVVATLNNYNIQTRFRRFQAKVEIGEGIVVILRVGFQFARYGGDFNSVGKSDF